jgi:hypothetical protein
VSELRHLVASLAARIAPTWTEQQVQSCVYSVLDRAERSRRGEASVWNGYEIDPRYTPSNTWLIDALRITPEEERELKTIIGTDEARRRDADRATAKRRAAGVQPRAAFIEAAHARRDRATALRAKGLTWAEVGAELGISAGAARALGSRANDEAHRSVRISGGGVPVGLAAERTAFDSDLPSADILVPDLGVRAGLPATAVQLAIPSLEAGLLPYPAAVSAKLLESAPPDG